MKSSLSYPAFIVLISSLVALGALSIDLYMPSMPAMAADLATDPARVQLTMGAFLAGYAVSQIFCGPLCDRFGRRWVMIWGIAIYLAATIGCVLATDVETLIALRFVQAFGACAGPVIGRAVVRDLYELEDAARAYAYIGMMMIVTPMLAPILGAWIEVTLGWRANFGFMAGFGAVILIATVALLAETLARPDIGALRPARIARNYRTLLVDRRFMGYGLTIGLSFAGVFAFITGSSFVLIELLGLSPMAFSLLFSLTVIGYAAGSYTTARLTPKLGIDRAILYGVAIFVAGVLGLNAFAFAGIFTAAAICGPMVVLSFGNGMIVPNCQAGAISPFPHMAGVAAAMMGFLSMAGAALGGWVSARFYDGTQFSMTLTLLVSAGFMSVAFFGLIWHRRESAPSAPRP